MSLQWQCGYICSPGFKKEVGFHKRSPSDQLPCDKRKIVQGACLAVELGESHRRGGQALLHAPYHASELPRTCHDSSTHPRRRLEEDGEDDARKLETAAVRGQSPRRTLQLSIDDHQRGRCACYANQQL